MTATRCFLLLTLLLLWNPPTAQSGFIATASAHAEARGEVADDRPDFVWTQIPRINVSPPPPGYINASSAGALRSTESSQGSAFASLSTGGNPVLKASANASTNTPHGPDPNPWGMVTTASASFADTISATRDGVVIGNGSLRVSWAFSGSASFSGSGAHASATMSVAVGGYELGTDNLIELFSRSASNEDLHTFEGQGAFNDTFAEAPVFILDPVDLSRIQVYVHLDVVAVTTTEPGQAEADASNSLWVFLEFLDEYGDPDPTIVIESAGGMDYTPRVIPEPSSFVLAGVALGALLCAARRKALRMPR